MQNGSLIRAERQKGPVVSAGTGKPVSFVTSATVYGRSFSIVKPDAPLQRALQSLGLRLHFGNMPKLYRVEGFDVPQVVPVLSGILTHDEAKKYRADLTAKGVHPSDIWITEVDEHGAAKNINKRPRPTSR